ncbi:MAG: DEAD/DEAH box helicase [Gaiella sp.]
MDQITFAALGVPQDIAGTLEERGFAHPFQIQERVLPIALQGTDVLAKSPTGSGKTLAFAIPIVALIDPAEPRPSALVLVPTRELAVQVTEELDAVGRPLGLRTMSVYGGVPLPAQAKRAAEAHCVVATPGRLQDLVDRRMLSLDAVRILVLDEADRMLDMGFKPQVDRIVKRLTSDRQTMFFSATLDGEVGDLARLYTRFPVRVEAELPHDRAQGTIDHRFVPVTPENKLETLASLVHEADGLALVFVRTKRGADRLAQRLKAADVSAIAMHGDMSQAQREKALARFTDGKVKLLIATDVAARGLDLDDVTLVVNYDPPEDGKAYTHRVGRTGRAGRSGDAVTLVLPEQQTEVSRVARLNGQADTFAETGMKVAAPRLVYSSRKRGSKWGAPRARRKI